jgi:probable rRNA maturation factor
MVKVLVFKQGNYPVSSKKIQEIIKKTLIDNGIVSNFSVDVALVGYEKMDELVKAYYKEDPKGEWDHPILTFPASEVKEKFVTPEGEVPSLGDMVISYPSAVERAKESGKLVEEIVMELAEHGTLHLLGIHH